MTRRDGNAWTMAKLSGGATVSLVEFWPYEAPEEASEEAEGMSDAAGGAEHSTDVRVGNDAPTEPDLPPIIIED